MQQKYLQFQTLQQQIEQISEHVEMLNQQNMEIDVSIMAIKEVGKTEIGKEILAPIANGIFLKSELKDNQRLVVNVGSEVTVEKTIQETAELLERQKEKTSSKIIEANEVLKELNEEAMKIYEEVSKAQR